MVSIIVTLYNKENYIRDCLNSILSNLDTYKDIEIIIVNDKSTDNSLNIVNEYKIKYHNNIKIYNNEKNIGAGASRQKGLQYATGEYIHFLDADDMISSTFYKTMIDLIIEKDVDIIWGAFNIFYDNNSELIPMKQYKTNLLITNDNKRDIIFKINYFRFQFLGSGIIKSSLFKNGAIYCPSRFVEDTPTILILLTLAKRIYVTDLDGYYYRQVQDSLMHINTIDSRLSYTMRNMGWACHYIIDNIDKELGTQLLYDYKCKLKNTITQHLYTSLKLSVINKQNYEDIKKFYNISDNEIDELVDYVQQHVSKVIYLD